MNVNDLVCVGAEPIALLDYLAVERAEPDMLRGIAEGLKRGAEQAGVEIPGGELRPAPGAAPRPPLAARLRPERRVLRNRRLDAMVTGSAAVPGDSSACPPPACTPTA